MPRRSSLLLLVLLGCGLAWGSTQTLGKIAVSTGHPPMGLLFWQFALGAALAGGITWARGRRLVLTRGTWSFAAVVALVGTLIPGTTFYVSVARLPAGIMSLLISTTPMLAFLLAILLRQDRFTALRGLGLLLGLAAVALVAGPDAALPDPRQAAFLPLALIGPLFYAIETNFVQRVGLGPMDPFQAMALASLVGAAMALPLALGTGQWVDPLIPWGSAEWAFVAGALVHLLTYAAYVWLAARAGSTFASQCSYIVTASGLLWASTLLGERFSPWVWAALPLLLAGLALVRPRETATRAV